MKKLLVAMLALLAFSCHPVPAGANPDVVRKFEQKMHDDARKAGMELGECKVAVEDTAPGVYLVSAQCSNMRYMCLFAVREADGAVQPIGCIDNPEFKESERIDSRTKL